MSNKKRFIVFFSVDCHYPPRLGFQLHLHALARSLSGFIPTKLFCWGKGPVNSDESFVELIDPTGAPSVPLGRHRYFLAQADRWMQANAAPGSILWVRGYNSALMLLPRLLANRRDRSEFTYLYDAASFLKLEWRLRGNGWTEWAKGRIEELLWGRFSQIRTLNDHMREYLVRKGIPRESVSVWPVGSEPRTSQWQLEDRDRRVLYVGSAQRWQGLNLLLEAMELLWKRQPHIHLDVVGAEESEIRNRRSNGNVTFHGKVPPETVESMYLEHDLFVIPRPRSPLTELVTPMKLIEAMSYGIPILATDLPAIRWVAGEQGACYVSRSTPDDLAAGIESVLSDPDNLAVLSKGALERSRGFLWPEIAARIYRDLTASPMNSEPAATIRFPFGEETR
jgi:glycosyltransferase involved in cell wall biosynthesis